MKTKVLTITVLLIGGLIFSSCKKDDSLTEEISMEQFSAKDNYIEDSAEANFGIRFQNYPDPFMNSTKISYHLVRSNFVQLDVYAAGSKKRILLLKEYQKAGVHTFDFDGKQLSPGKYIAELKIGNKVYRDTMTKMNWLEDDSKQKSDY